VEVERNSIGWSKRCINTKMQINIAVFFVLVRIISFSLFWIIWSWQYYFVPACYEVFLDSINYSWRAGSEVRACLFDDLSWRVRTSHTLKRTFLILQKAPSVRTSIRGKQMNSRVLHANEVQAIFHLFICTLCSWLWRRWELGWTLVSDCLMARLRKTGNWSWWLMRRRPEFGNKQFQALHVISRETAERMEMSSVSSI